MSPVAPAISLMMSEWGPATLMTIGASISRPSLERDALDPPVVAADLGHGRAEEELAAVRLRGPLEVVRGELRVVDVARARRVDRAGEALLGLVPEVRVLGALGRIERVRVEDRHALLSSWSVVHSSYSTPTSR